MITSYGVRGRTLCSLSKAPHSQFIAIGESGGRFMCASFGMDPQSSMYAALQPVPKIHPILTFSSVYADAIRVPVVSLMSAVSLIGQA